MSAYYTLMAVTLCLFGTTFVWWARDGWLLARGKVDTRGEMIVLPDDHEAPRKTNIQVAAC